MTEVTTQSLVFANGALTVEVTAGSVSDAKLSKLVPLVDALYLTAKAMREQRDIRDAATGEIQKGTLVAAKQLDAIAAERGTGKTKTERITSGRQDKTFYGPMNRSLLAALKFDAGSSAIRKARFDAATKANPERAKDEQAQANNGRRTVVTTATELATATKPSKAGLEMTPVQAVAGINLLVVFLASAPAVAGIVAMNDEAQADIVASLEGVKDNVVGILGMLSGEGVKLPAPKFRKPRKSRAKEKPEAEVSEPATGTDG